MKLSKQFKINAIESRDKIGSLGELNKSISKKHGLSLQINRWEVLLEFAYILA